VSIPSLAVTFSFSIPEQYGTVTKDKFQLPADMVQMELTECMVRLGWVSMISLFYRGTSTKEAM